MPPPKKKLPPNATADESTMTARARASLLGLAMGEAFGGPHEFKSLYAPEFPQLAVEPFDDFMRGGRYELLRGQTGQATQQAVVLSNAIRELSAPVDEWVTRRTLQQVVAKGYVAWLSCAFDVSEANKAALEMVRNGRSPEAAGRAAWLDSAQTLRDNAALARTAPIGLYYCRDREARINATFEDCQVTHFHPECQLACATVNGILAAALTSPKERPDNSDLLKAIDAELNLAASTLGNRFPEWIVQIQEATEKLREDVGMAQRADPELYGPDLHLFHRPTSTRIAFRLALWELFHAPSLHAGIVDAVNRGGDADTNAALTGALLGALHGDKSLPEHWREVVLEGPWELQGPLNSVYHPRFLVTFAGQFSKPAVSAAAPLAKPGPKGVPGKAPPPKPGKA